MTFKLSKTNVPTPCLKYSGQLDEIIGVVKQWNGTAETRVLDEITCACILRSINKGRQPFCYRRIWSIHSE